MALQYWNTMAEREKNKMIPMPENAKGFDENARSEEKTVSADNTGTNVNSVSAENTGTNVNSVSAVDTGTAGNNEAEVNNESEKSDVKRTNMPRPLAAVIGVLLTVLSSIGLSVLMALMIIITIGCAVFSLALMAGGGFTVFEAFTNIGSSPIVSLQCMGIGFAVFALGLLLMLATLKCISTVLPAVAELFPKTVGLCLSL